MVRGPPPRRPGEQGRWRPRGAPCGSPRVPTHTGAPHLAFNGSLTRYLLWKLPMHRVRGLLQHSRQLLSKQRMHLRSAGYERHRKATVWRRAAVSESRVPTQTCLQSCRNVSLQPSRPAGAGAGAAASWSRASAKVRTTVAAGTCRRVETSCRPATSSRYLRNRACSPGPQPQVSPLSATPHRLQSPRERQPAAGWLARPRRAGAGHGARRRAPNLALAAGGAAPAEGGLQLRHGAFHHIAHADISPAPRPRRPRRLCAARACSARRGLPPPPASRRACALGAARARGGLGSGGGGGARGGRGGAKCGGGDAGVVASAPGWGPARAAGLRLGAFLRLPAGPGRNCTLLGTNCTLPGTWCVGRAGIGCLLCAGIVRHGEAVWYQSARLLNPGVPLSPTWGALTSLGR